MIEVVFRKSLLYLLIALILLLYWVFISKRYKKASLTFILLLFLYRLPFIFVYINFIPGDWVAYYRELSSTTFIKEAKFSLGTESITWIAKNLEFFSPQLVDYFFVFSLFGYFGCCIFYIIIHTLIKESDRISIGKLNFFPWLLLYPSLHMYTVMLGKDPIIFWGVALVSLGVSKRNTNWFYVLLGISAAFIVRPHMGVVLIISLCIALLISREWNFLKKSILFMIMSFLSVLLLPKAISLFRIRKLSFEGIMKAIEMNEGFVNDAGTFVDMSNYPMPLKMFTYLFRPLFIDSPNVLLLEYSMENFIFLLLLLFNLSINFFPWIRKQPLVVKFSFVYFLLGTLVLSNGLSVFGLFIRQKTMIFLNFILLLFAFIYYRKTKKQNINNI